MSHLDLSHGSRCHHLCHMMIFFRMMIDPSKNCDFCVYKCKTLLVDEFLRVYLSQANLSKLVFFKNESSFFLKVSLLQNFQLELFFCLVNGPLPHTHTHTPTKSHHFSSDFGSQVVFSPLTTYKTTIPPTSFKPHTFFSTPTNHQNWRVPPQCHPQEIGSY